MNSTGSRPFFGFAVALACAVAVVASGCGTEVPGQDSVAGSGVEDGGAEQVPGAGEPPRPRDEVKPPSANAIVDYQIGGDYPPAPGVGVVIRDRQADPAEGIYSICYVNAFQVQPGERAFWLDHHPDLVLRSASGRIVEDEEWGEPLLDISTRDKRERLAGIVGGWMTDCAGRGFRAVEPDNLDSWTRSGGRLDREQATEYSRLLTDRARERGLAVAQKNAAELSDAQIRRAGFDFAIVEDCQQYTWDRGSECDRYLSVYGDRVIEIEYSDGGSAAFDTACRERGERISVLLRDRDVTPRGDAGYVNRTC